MRQRFGTLRLSKMARFLIMIIMNGLWQACLVKCWPQAYVVGFPENELQGHAHLRITVTNVCERQIHVKIVSYLLDEIDTYVLRPATSNITAVPRELMVKRTEKTKNGIKVTTTGEATVYIAVNKVSSMEGTMAIPVRSLGSRHYVVTGASTEGVTKSEILLVGVTNQTVVTVTIKTTTTANYDRLTFFTGGIIHLEMDEFDTVQIQSDSGDLTGTLIVSSSPISVFSGNQAVSINTNVGYLLEQIPATNLWQTEFVTLPPKGFEYSCKVVAAFPWTVLRYQCSSAGWHDLLMIHPGAYATLPMSSAICTVIASRPILLTMIIDSTTLGAAMVVLQPLREVNKSIMFNVPENLESAQIVLFTYTDDIDDITLDSAILTNVLAMPFEPLYVGVVEDIDFGTHIIETSGSSLRVSGYIFGRFDSKTSAFPLLFQNSSCRVNLTTTPPTAAATTKTAATYINDTVYNPTASNLNNAALIATTTSPNSLIDESSRSKTETTSYIVIGTPDPPNENSISPSERTSESTAETTATTLIATHDETTETAATRIATYDETTETTAATRIATHDKTTEIRADTIKKTHERSTETSPANFVETPEQTTEITTTVIATYAPTTKTLSSISFSTSAPTSESTASTVTAPTVETFGTTTALRIATSEPTTASTETASKTTDIVFESSETTTANADRTTIGFIDGTPIVQSSEPSLNPLDGTTRISTAEGTAITEKSSQVPTKSSIRPIICGTYIWANLTCYHYCANRTRETNIRIIDMRVNLIDRKSTNRYLRSLTSAPDDRTSARTIGYTGVIVLVAVFLFVVILDVKAGGKSKKRHLKNSV